jgi:hypothetical protein
MLNRVVTIALGIAISLFLFEVIWPILDDDPASPLQTAYFTAGLIVATLLALVSLGGPS